MFPPTLRLALRCLVLTPARTTLLAPSQRLNLPISSYAARAAPPPSQKHAFSTSAPRQAAETGSNQFDQQNFAALMNSPLMRQVADKPEAMKALMDFAQLMKEQGIEMNGAAPPSPLQIIKLASNKQLRAAASNLAVKLREAGVNLTRENAMEMLMGSSNPTPKP